MQNVGTKRHIWTTIKSVWKESNEKDIQPNKKSRWHWRIRTNEKIYLLITHADIVRHIKAQRIRWIGHVVRMDKERVVKRITEWRPIAVRRIGRPTWRWEDDVKANIEKMKILNWGKMPMDRDAWKRVVERPKLMKSCNTRRRRSNLRVWSLVCDATLLDLESMKMVVTCSFKTLGTT